MRWAHSAVEYWLLLWAGTGGGAEQPGAVGERVVVIPIVLGVLEAMVPHTLPPHSSHAAPPTRLPIHLPTEFPHTVLGGMLNQLLQVGPIRGMRSGNNVTALMNTLCLPTCRGGGCPMHLDCCHLTACRDTQCNICTPRLQLHVCVGCNVRLTVNNQPNNHITHTCGSSPHSLRIRQGVCCRGTQRMHKRCKH